MKVKLLKGHQEPDLHLIGVPTESHHRNPGPYVFPSRFNVELRKNWDSMFKTEPFRTFIKGKEAKEQWHCSIKEFLGIAKRLGANPFHVHYLETENGKIGKLIKTHRHAIHKVLTNVGFLGTKVKGAKPSVTKNSSGFVLTLSCRFNPSNVWPTPLDMSKHLIKSGFAVDTKGHYAYSINPEAHIYVDTKNSTFNYAIKVNRHPVIKSWRVITKSKYSSFIINKVWKTLLAESPSPIPRFHL